MKNIFKFLGIAVLACGMMVSCGKDNPEEGTDTTPVTPPTPTYGDFTVTFDGNSWAAGATKFIDFTSENDPYITVYAYKTAADVNASQASDVYIMGWLDAVVGNFTYNDFASYIKYYDPTNPFSPTETVTIGQNTFEAGSYYWRYNPVTESFTETITALDLNERTMTATFSENIFDVENYIANNGQSYGDLYVLSGNLANYHWAAWTPASK